MGRKFFVGGNWKMNSSLSANEALVKQLNDGEQKNKDVEVILAPPAPYLQSLKSSLRSDWQVSAQNVYKATSGAYTGEISPAMLKDLGINWAILGHSERRAIFGESDELIGEKCAFALEQGLKIIPCIGESLEEREAGKTLDVCIRQLKAISDRISDWTNVVIAYEPVWAIGTGKTASPEQANEVHEQIRSWISSSVSKDVADSVRIIYGGSVNPGNCDALSGMADIDGFLVGGASLKPDFITIVNAGQ